MKFGGTSVGTAERIKNVAKIIVDHQKTVDIVVVVSAVSGVTNLLVASVAAASNKNKFELTKNMDLIREIHNNIIVGLRLSKTQEASLQLIVDNHLLHLESLLYSVYELGEVTPRSMDLISSFGERMTIHFISSALLLLGAQSQPIESQELIVTNDDFGNAQPLLKESIRKMKPQLEKLIKKNVVPVITGFIGATKKGVLTTLGRGGSDFSATIVGHCIDADEVWIWTDVDGAMTADPKVVKNARTIPALAYDEAIELSYFGAKVLHPLTIVPAELKKIPVWIKNTFNPDFVGTKISEEVYKNGHPVKAVSTMSSLSLVTLQGKGIIGVPGTVAKVFNAIAKENINVLFISQASSEHNISFVVKSIEGDKTITSLKQAFRTELLDKRIDSIAREEAVALVAIVGAGMAGYPGIAGKAFSALGKEKINLIAIAQGSSELNISFVVKQSDVHRAVQRIHDAFSLDTVH